MCETICETFAVNLSDMVAKKKVGPICKILTQMCASEII